MPKVKHRKVEQVAALERLACLLHDARVAVDDASATGAPIGGYSYSSMSTYLLDRELAAWSSIDTLACDFTDEDQAALENALSQ
jgi:hypothetical protein